MVCSCCNSFSREYGLADILDRIISNQQSADMVLEVLVSFSEQTESKKNGASSVGDGPVGDARNDAPFWLHLSGTSEYAFDEWLSADVICSHSGR